MPESVTGHCSFSRYQPLQPCLQGSPEVHTNAYVEDGARFQLPVILSAAAQGIECFDCPFYAVHNNDLPETQDCSALFSHWINFGQFEGRPARCAPALPLLLCGLVFLSLIGFSRHSWVLLQARVMAV